MQWVRIDNRLVHGQIIETWLPHTRTDTIVVANKKVASDMIQQEIMSLAIPQSTHVRYVIPEEVKRTVAEESGECLVLFASCEDAMAARSGGFSFEVLNIGNIHYAPGKRQLSPSVALSESDDALLREFRAMGVELDFRCVPNDPVQVRF